MHLNHRGGELMALDNHFVKYLLALADKLGVYVNEEWLKDPDTNKDDVKDLIRRFEQMIRGPLPEPTVLISLVEHGEEVMVEVAASQAEKFAEKILAENSKYFETFPYEKPKDSDLYN